MTSLSPVAWLTIAALALIIIGVVSMRFQRSVKIERRKSRGETKKFFSAPDSLGADGGCVPGFLGLLLIIVGIVLLLLIAGQYAHDHPVTPIPTPESFRSLLM